jgi:hypothetical protein
MAMQSTAPTRPHAFDALSARLAGELITPGHHDYETAPSRGRLPRRVRA